MRLARTEVEFPRDSDGKLSAFAWPGGYPIVYICGDGGTLCPACANGENGSDASTTAEDKRWLLIGADIHWEGEPMACDHCCAEIESAYGAPE
jgi:hypothetical protein